jgi:small subunit ribosomal protein S6
MALKNYETVFILTPILSDQQAKDTVQKFKDILANLGASIVHEEHWGMKKLAYPVNKKREGIYHLIEFKAEPASILRLETEYKRDENVMRHIIIALDKYAVAYNERRRTNRSHAKKVEKEEVA